MMDEDQCRCCAGTGKIMCEQCKGVGSLPELPQPSVADLVHAATILEGWQGWQGYGNVRYVGEWLGRKAWKAANE
jgi:hypothetical protein